MNYKINSSKLEYILKQPEYSIPTITLTKADVLDSEYKKMEKCNRILGRSFHHTFEMWHRKWGRIPTPQEFIAMQMQDVYKKFGDECWRRNYKINFELTPITVKGIKQRILRSYISFINELHTRCIITESFPLSDIQSNDVLDFAGIDLLVVDRKYNIEHKIHITKNSTYAIDFLFRKEGKELNFERTEGVLWSKPNWKKINHPIYRNRNFKGHVFLLYGTVADETTFFINGYPLFRKEYIIHKLTVNIMLKKGA